MTTTRSEDGFTLVEILVTMAIALIVLAATLNVLNVFSNDSNAMTQRNAAQNQARLAIDRIVRQLRNIASPVTSPKLLAYAAPYDIVFETIGPPSAVTSGNPAGIQWVRYCIPQDTPGGSAASEVLISQTLTWTSTNAGSDPWSTTACPDTTSPSSVLVSGVTNRYRQQTGRPAFTYNGGAAPSSLATIDTVGLDLFVNPTPRLKDAETELRSSAFLRNQQRQPVANFTYTPLGNGTVLLNGGTSYDPSGEPLTYSWSCTGSTPCASSAAIFSWSPGPGTYTVTVTVTDPAGLRTGYNSQVTVT